MKSKYPELLFIYGDEEEDEGCLARYLPAEEGVPPTIEIFFDPFVSYEEWIHILFHEVGHHVTRRWGETYLEKERSAWKRAEMKLKKFGLWNPCWKQRVMEFNLEFEADLQKLREEC